MRKAWEFIRALWFWYVVRTWWYYRPPKSDPVVPREEGLTLDDD